MSWHRAWDYHWREHGDWWRGIFLQHLVGLLLGLGFLAGGLAEVNIAWLAITWAVVMGCFEIVAGVHLRRELGTGRLLCGGGAVLLLFALLAIAGVSTNLVVLRYAFGIVLLLCGAVQTHVGLALRAAQAARGWVIEE